MGMGESFPLWFVGIWWSVTALRFAWCRRLDAAGRPSAPPVLGSEPPLVKTENRAASISPAWPAAPATPPARGAADPWRRGGARDGGPRSRRLGADRPPRRRAHSEN